MLGVFALHHTFFFSAQRPGVEFFLYVLCIGIHFLFSSFLFFSSFPSGFCFPFSAIFHFLIFLSAFSLIIHAPLARLFVFAVFYSV